MGALSLHLRVALVIMGALLVVSVVAYCQDASKPADSQEKVLSSLGVAAFGIALMGFGINYGIARKRLNKGD